jgi:heme-degrading monooxygenase HmoA
VVGTHRSVFAQSDWMRLAMTAITLFEVPPAADEAFVAAWSRACDGGARSVLHRALREDVDFRFVDVARVSPEDFPGREIPFPSHPALYETVHEDGAPDGTEGVVLINAFEVPPEADAAFAAGWERAREFLAAHPGYLGTRLHRSLGEADFRFVDIARWSSPLPFSKAVARPEFRAASAALAFPSHRALYLVIRQ